MIALKGTEKQISWANDLRTNQINYWQRALDGDCNTVDLHDVFNTTTPSDALKNGLVTVIEKAKKIESAVFWIDAKNKTTMNVLREIYKMQNI